MKKTNAVRLLDQQNITYQLFPYASDEQHQEVAAIAAQLSIAEQHVFKTLVAKGDKTGVLVALIPGDRQLVYKSLARLSGNRKVRLVAVKELPALTGYIRGGCSPIGMSRNYPVYIDATALGLNHLWINAGQRGLLVKLGRSDLMRLTAAISGEIAV